MSRSSQHTCCVQTACSSLRGVDEDRVVGQSCIAELVKQQGNQMDWEPLVDPTVLLDKVSCSQVVDDSGAHTQQPCDRKGETDLVVRKGRDIILQGTQLIHVVLSDNVRSAGQNLPGLDKGGSKRRENLSAVQWTP